MTGIYDPVKVTGIYDPVKVTGIYVPAHGRTLTIKLASDERGSGALEPEPAVRLTLEVTAHPGLDHPHDSYTEADEPWPGAGQVRIGDAFGLLLQRRNLDLEEVDDLSEADQSLVESGAVVGERHDGESS